MKRLLSLLSLLMISISLFAVEFVVDGIKYQTTSSNTVEVTRDSYSGDIVIPESVVYDNINYSVTSIGSAAFSGCSGLTSVSIPNSVTSIGSGAFWCCEGLTSVSIGNSMPSENNVTRIYNEAFANCKSLTSLFIGTDILIYDNSFPFGGSNNISTITFNCSEIQKWFSGMESLEKVIIGNKVKSIDSKAFYGCRNLTTAIIEDGVESVGQYAFCFCNKLNSIILPNSLKSIGSEAFRGCSSITSIRIPDSVTSLGLSTFAECDGLNYVSIGAGLEDVPTWTFQLCNNLISLYVNSRIIKGSFAYTSFKEVIIGDNVEEIFYNTFASCSQLKTLTLGKNLKSIGKECFTNCKLSSITIKSSPIALHKYSFWRCGVKTLIYQCKEVYSFINSTVHPSEIVFSDSVTSIHDNAFSSNNTLTSVKSESMIPPDLEENAFNNETYENATLYVPRGSLTRYSQHQYWKKFKKIVEIDVSGINIIKNSIVENGSIYNLNGIKVDGNSLDKGVYIKNGKKVFIK